MSKITHVLFDMDGLILDTEPLYTEATVQVATKYGSSVHFSWDLKVRQMGLPRLDLANLIIKEMELPITVDQYIEETVTIQERSFPNCKLLPGAEKLIDHLHSSGVHIALATSSPRDSYLLKTRNYQELFSKFNHVVNGSDDSEVKRGKPNPDIFLVCASRFASPPDQPSCCLVFEDSPAGVKAALGAGMECVMVPDERMFSTPHHIPQGVNKVIKSLQDFIPEEFGLPQY
jgi:pseudouridine-5'-monophosphatase